MVEVHTLKLVGTYRLQLSKKELEALIVIKVWTAMSFCNYNGYVRKLKIPVKT